VKFDHDEGKRKSLICRISQLFHCLRQASLVYLASERRDRVIKWNEEKNGSQKKFCLGQDRHKAESIPADFEINSSAPCLKQLGSIVAEADLLWQR
jgi:hypothetical protein